MYDYARCLAPHADPPPSDPSRGTAENPIDGNAARLAVLAGLLGPPTGRGVGGASGWDAFDIGSEFAPLMGARVGGDDTDGGRGPAS